LTLCLALRCFAFDLGWQGPVLLRKQRGVADQNLRAVDGAAHAGRVGLELGDPGLSCGFTAISMDSVVGLGAESVRDGRRHRMPGPRFDGGGGLQQFGREVGRQHFHGSSGQGPRFVEHDDVGLPDPLKDRLVEDDDARGDGFSDVRRHGERRRQPEPPG
jgi:hypothetical protein